MSLTLTGQKQGMVQIFGKDGEAIPCTAILVEPNHVVSVKTVALDGYSAVQLGGIPIKKPRRANTRKPQKGLFDKTKVSPCRALLETRVSDSTAYQVGQPIDLSLFQDISHVDVQSISKGKGFQGVMKLHGFAGGPAAHGSGFHRHAGSTGQRSTPGRCFPNGKRASRMGGDKKTVENLEVVGIQGNLLLVRGAVPGAKNGTVYIRQAMKKQKKRG